MGPYPLMDKWDRERQAEREREDARQAKASRGVDVVDRLTGQRVAHFSATWQAEKWLDQGERRRYYEAEAA